MPHGQFINAATEARQLAFALVEGRPREAALAAAARAVGVSKWTYWSLYHGRRKLVDYGVLAALRREYLKLCETQIARLEAEVRDLRRKSGDEAVADIAPALARLAEKVRKARSAYR